MLPTWAEKIFAEGHSDSGRVDRVGLPAPRLSIGLYEIVCESIYTNHL